MKKTLFLILVAMATRAYSSCQDIYDRDVTNQMQADQYCEDTCSHNELHWNGQWIYKHCGCCDSPQNPSEEHKKGKGGKGK
jgi:hypothetical protein